MVGSYHTTLPITGSRVSPEVTSLFIETTAVLGCCYTTPADNFTWTRDMVKVLFTGESQTLSGQRAEVLGAQQRFWEHDRRPRSTEEGLGAQQRAEFVFVLSIVFISI